MLFLEVIDLVSYISAGVCISLTADPAVLVINHELGSSVETALWPWMSNITHREQFNEGQSARALGFADSCQFDAPYTCLHSSLCQIQEFVRQRSAAREPQGWLPVQLLT